MKKTSMLTIIQILEDYSVQLDTITKELERIKKEYAEWETMKPTTNSSRGGRF